LPYVNGIVQGAGNGCVIPNDGGHLDKDLMDTGSSPIKDNNMDVDNLTKSGDGGAKRSLDLTTVEVDKEQQGSKSEANRQPWRLRVW
jgi:hypothetical protein